jgi:hypothetical protein
LYSSPSPHHSSLVPLAEGRRRSSSLHRSPSPSSPYDLRGSDSSSGGGGGGGGGSSRNSPHSVFSPPEPNSPLLSGVGGRYVQTVAYRSQPQHRMHSSSEPSSPLSPLVRFDDQHHLQHQQHQQRASTAVPAGWGMKPSASTGSLSGLPPTHCTPPPRFPRSGLPSVLR